MEKQHNRGQDGAGIATVKVNTEPGYPFMYRLRNNSKQSLSDLFSQIWSEINEVERYQPEIKNHPGLMKGHINVLGEVLLGHLRYGTQGKNDLEFCHPFVKRNTIPSRNIALAGNFNIVNTEEILRNFDQDFCESDLAAMLEVIHKNIVEEDEAHPEELNIENVLRKSIKLFDGGYHVGGVIGNGDGFVFRDAHGIRPAYYFINDEVIVAASERAAIRTAFNLDENEVKELNPGESLIAKADGSFKIIQLVPPLERKACSFERIYFSRGSDEKIYKERIALGYNLSATVLKAIEYDLKNTIFSFIPNTAETAFYGLIKGAEDYLNKIKIERILSWNGNIDEEKLSEMVNRRIRVEKIAIKDVKLRTFITEDNSRNEMVQHVYDITYGTVRKGIDTLVVIDDSIVRGTTLKESIVRMLARLKPKEIIIVSSAPQIRYPDCYGIDMSKIGDFIAFKAVLALIKERKMEGLLTEVFDRCKQLESKGELQNENLVKQLYKPFSTEEITNKISELITPEDIRLPISVIFQKIEDLHSACPNNLGDWYFTGNYPTQGGNKVCNRAFMNFMEGKNKRGY